MQNFQYTQDQQEIINCPLDTSLFIEGPATSGKTSAAIARLGRIHEIMPGHQVMIIVPQKSLAQPYQEYLTGESTPLGGVPKITTLSGLSQELMGVFWPVIKPLFGFNGAGMKPEFLSLESAQYCMQTVVSPLLEQGFFQSVKIEQNRLFSQILDNLNKTAIHNLPLGEISQRLFAGSTEPSAVGSAFDQVQECAQRFRSFCLEHNLIDYSLLTKITNDYLFQAELPLRYLQARYRVLIADNIEEDTPVAHQLFRIFLDSDALVTLLFDYHAGFRTFLGADPINAYHLKPLCQTAIQTTLIKNESDTLAAFRDDLNACIDHRSITMKTGHEIPANVHILVHRFLPEMIDNVVENIDQLVRSGVSADQIAVLSPYLSDVLKFALTEKLKRLGIPSQTLRPSRKYVASSSIKALLCIAEIAHPTWNPTISDYDLRDSLMRLIPDLDIIRAEYAVKALHAKQSDANPIRSFSDLTNFDLQEKITFAIGIKLDQLSQWITEYINRVELPLDIFIQRLFSELLSQPDFKLHNDLNVAGEIAKMVWSIKQFRSFSANLDHAGDWNLGKEYIQTIKKGLLPSAFYTDKTLDQGIAISPAHTFLMGNRRVRYQFWLDIGSLGWWERLYQPLTNPYVFQKQWKNSDSWDEEKEYAINQNMMGKLINGLLLRCKDGVYATVVQTNEFGAQNNGPLLKAFQKLIKRSIHNP